MKRYDPIWCNDNTTEMEEYDDGEWIRYSDYVKAEARVKELEQRLADEVKVSCELNRELILKRIEQ